MTRWAEKLPSSGRIGFFSRMRRMLASVLASRGTGNSAGVKFGYLRRHAGQLFGGQAAKEFDVLS
jgi:hypothetical protein